MIRLFTLTSPLHDKSAIEAGSAAFIGAIENALGPESGMEFKGDDFSSYGEADLDLIYVRTGGTEGLFKPLFENGSLGSDKTIFLLTSGKSNSLAASMEILSYLRKNRRKGEIIHGTPEYIAGRIRLLADAGRAMKRLRGTNLGVVGRPSDWLISSAADADALRSRLGINLIDIPMSELIEEIGKKEYPENDAVLAAMTYASGKDVEQPGGVCNRCAGQRQDEARKYVEGALHIYGALSRIIARYNLSGLTIRCFDLLTAVKNTGCLALAILNSQGIPAGCEGDIPAMLTMAVSNALTGVTGFQANPSMIDPQTGKMLFAHCTIPLNLVDGYSFDTHFESGIGVAIHGNIPYDELTVAKISGDASRHFAEEATVCCNQYKEDLCRTQVIMQMDDPGACRYFLENPIGNHHIIIPGRRKELIDTFFNYL